MATATYSAVLGTRLYNATTNYRNTVAAYECQYNAATNYAGLISFSGLDMTGKVVNSVSLTVTSEAAGYGAWFIKTVYLRKSNYQNTTTEGVTGAAYAGDLLGTIKSEKDVGFHNNTVTISLTGELLSAVAAYLQAGNNTFVLYNPSPTYQSGANYSENFLVWADVKIAIEYENAASKPTPGASTVAMGAAVTINTNRQSESATHTISYTFGSASGTIGMDVADSISWTPPVSLAAQIPNATSGVCTITCQTYFGGTLTGTEVCTLTLTVPASVAPTITSITAEDSVTLPSGITGYVQGVSVPTVTITAAGAQGSTITGYQSMLDGLSYSGARFTARQALSADGSVTITTTVTDSRGRTATSTETLMVKPYARPAISVFRAERCSADGSTAQPDGTNVRVTATGSVSSLDEQNTIAAAVYYKPASATAWAQDKALTTSGQAVSVTNELLTTTYDALISYDIKLVIADAFGNTEQQTSIGTKTVIMDFLVDGSGMAIGKVAEESGVMEVGWPLKLTKPLGIEQGGTGGDTAEGAAASLGVLKNTTDTLTGALTVTNTGTTAQIHMTPQRATSGRLGFARIDAAANGYFGFYAFSGESIGTYRALWVNNPAYQTSLDNALYLRTNEGGSATNYRVFHAGMASGVPVNKGGTGATTAAAARTNLGTNDAGNITAGTLDMARLPFRIAHGQTTITGAQWQTVTFESGLFTAAPTVVVSYADDAATSGIAPLKTRDETATGFEVCMAASSGSGDRKVNWIAVGV